jgi:dTDP-glucose 4,6-dehydratase
LKILVTGGAGFIGSTLIKSLLKNESHRILNLDVLTYADSLSALANAGNDPRYQFAQIDICDQPSVAKALYDFKPDWILHLAAESHVDRSIENPKAFLQTNVIGTFNMLEVARRYYEDLSGAAKHAFRFLHVSTDEVYGSLGKDGLFSETSPYDPHSPYSASKAGSDHLVRAWATTYGLPVLVTNCSNNYGPYQLPDKLIPLIILKALTGEPIPIYGNGDNVRDWIYVSDHVDALQTIITKGNIGETYAIGGNNEKTNLDLVNCICKLLDQIKPNPNGATYSDQIQFVTDRPGHDKRYAIDSSKIRKQFGWTPKETLESGLKKTVHWYVSNSAWLGSISE